LALKLAHPRFEVQKIYQVQLDRALTRNNIKALSEGIELEDGVTTVDEAYYIQGTSKNNVIVVLHSGKYRIVRRMFEHLGYKVEKLDRAGYAGLTKAGLEVGQWRYLTNNEIACLKK
jgi:23S rRNA pseudouridine2605 synthase